MVWLKAVHTQYNALLRSYNSLKFYWMMKPFEPANSIVGFFYFILFFLGGVGAEISCKYFISDCLALFWKEKIKKLEKGIAYLLVFWFFHFHNLLPGLSFCDFNYAAVFYPLLPSQIKAPCIQVLFGLVEASASAACL